MAQPITAKFGKMQVYLGEASGTDPAALAVTSLSKTNPATCTVAPADITKFQNGMVVVIAGAVGTGLTNANGSHTISSVNTPANTFTLVGVDTSTGAAPQTTGVTATTKGLALNKNLQEVNIPDCDDPDAPVWLGRDCQNLSVTISGDGVAAAESVPDWNDAATATSSVPMKVDITFTSGIKSFAGNFHVDTLTFGAEQGGRVTLGFTAQSDGAISDTWTATP
jgi:hypothetical protein